MHGTVHARLHTDLNGKPQISFDIFVIFSFFLKIVVYVCVCVCLLYVRAHMCKCQWRPEEDVESSGAGVTGVCEPPNVGAGNRNRVL